MYIYICIYIYICMYMTPARGPQTVFSTILAHRPRYLVWRPAILAPRPRYLGNPRSQA